MVTQPSMRSKLLQKLLPGFTPCASATAMIAMKTRNAPNIQLRFGRYCGLINASASHAHVITSPMMRKVKFLPVMYGKKSEVETVRGTNGSAKTPTRTTHRSIFSESVIGGIVALLLQVN